MRYNFLLNKWEMVTRQPPTGEGETATPTLAKTTATAATSTTTAPEPAWIEVRPMKRASDSGERGASKLFKFAPPETAPNEPATVEATQVSSSLLEPDWCPLSQDELGEILHLDSVRGEFEKDM